MQKIIFLLVFILTPILAFSQSFTTPDTGVNWTLDEIAQQSPSTVSFDGTTYTLSEELIVSETDTLSINTGLKLEIDADIEVDIFGTFISDATSEIVITATDSLTPYEGFRFEDISEVYINNTTIKNGGGLKVITPDFIISNSYLAYNVSGSSTGAVISLSNGSPLITNNTFFQNELPAVSSAANAAVSATIIGNHIEGNVQSNQNRPQINMGPTGTDTLRIIQNTIIGDPAMDQVGGIAVSNFIGGEIRTIIDDNIIKNNRYGMTIAGGNAFAYIRGNIIEDNDTQNLPNLGGSGISLNSANPTQTIIASGNEFRGNLWGITVIGEAFINLGDGAGNPGGNIFSQNGNNGVIYALYNNTDNTILAKNNCWIEGQTNTLADAESVIFHQVDDASLGEVIFDPVSCSGMAVEELTANSVHFYPNPSKGKIKFNNSFEFETVHIYSVTGRLLNAKELQSGRNIIELNLPTGIYFLKFIRGNQSVGKKLVVE